MGHTLVVEQSISIGFPDDLYDLGIFVYSYQGMIHRFGHGLYQPAGIRKIGKNLVFVFHVDAQFRTGLKQNDRTTMFCQHRSGFHARHSPSDDGHLQG